MPKAFLWHTSLSYHLPLPTYKMKTGIIGAVPRSIKNERHVEKIYEATWDELNQFKHQRHLRSADPTEDLPRLRPTTPHQPQQDLSDQPFITVLWTKWFNPPDIPSQWYRIKTYLIKHD